MKRFFLLIVSLILVISLKAQVHFGAIFSDNMVLQAGMPIKIWGHGASGEVVTVFLDSQHITTTTDNTGKWEIEFSQMEYGDAITLKAVGRSNKVELKNIVVGDVWLCSGQSNMAMTINGAGGQVYNYKNEESNANYPMIRMFNVKPNLSADVGVDVEGEWDICSPETVSDFSAVAYFFARKIYKETGIPIGIINSSWGGTDIETWISVDAFKKLPEYYRDKYKDAENYGVDVVLQKNEDNRSAFIEAVSSDIGIEEQWYKPSHNTDSWKLMQQPQEWSGTELESFDGVVWFKYEFSLSDAYA